MSDLTLRARLRSISFAIEGLRVLLSTQANAKIHLVASLCVVSLAALLTAGAATGVEFLTERVLFIPLINARNLIRMGEAEKKRQACGAPEGILVAAVQFGRLQRFHQFSVLTGHDRFHAEDIDAASLRQAG